MKMLVRLAWRNVLRNKRRTLLSGIAVGITLASLIFVDGIYIGMIDSMTRTATDTFLGQGQIHGRGFRDTLEVEKIINKSGDIIRDLGTDDLVSAYSERTVSTAMLSSAAGVVSVLLYGIEPEAEKRLSMVDEALKEGKYLAPGQSGHILIGSKTAETLEVEIGDRLVITIAQAGTGELSQDMFRVGGIFNMGVREIDSGMAFVNITKSRELLALGRSSHEIALKFKDLSVAGSRSLPFWEYYSRSGNEALGWRDLIPQLDGIIELADLSTVITLSLVFCIVAIIIIHSLFMSLYERMFEFGILRAIGTRPVSMALIILFEAASLSIVSILFGLGLGFIIMQVFSIYGIPVMTLKQFTLFPALVFSFSIIAALYPAFYAARLTPARAMRRSM
jgi:ABC-type lipoprotein release transport system permease subunit